MALKSSEPTKGVTMEKVENTAQKTILPPPPAKNSIATATFATNVEFKDRVRNPEEVAQEMGEKANTGNLVILTMFGAISGVILLLISLYLSHIEALNAAVIINRPNQYWISVGLSLASAIFSVIGFQQMARWWKYKNVGGFLPILVEEAWSKDPASKTLYEILLRVIHEGRTTSGRLASIFFIANFVCSALTLWATISALPENAPQSVWIYTLSVSALAFISGACISLLTSADVTENSIINTAQSRYLNYARIQGSANEILGKK